MTILVDGTKLMVPYNGSWRFGIEVVRALVEQQDVSLEYPSKMDESILLQDLKNIARYETVSAQFFSLRQAWREIVSISRMSRYFGLVISPYCSMTGGPPRSHITISVLIFERCERRGKCVYALNLWNGLLSELPTFRDARKQVAFLIEALFFVRHLLPRDWTLTLVGDVPAELTHHVEKFGAHIRRVGLVDDQTLAGLYGESGSLAYP